MSTTKSLSDGKTRKEHPRLRRYKETLLYAKYCLFHPFDGFWDLVHEKRGSLAAAHTFLVLFLLTYVLRLMLTSFQFVTAPIQYINIYERFASLLLPFLILCVANWSLSTLFDGKGRRSKKREAAFLASLRSEIDAIAAEHDAAVDWEHPLNEARMG